MLYSAPDTETRSQWMLILSHPPSILPHSGQTFTSPSLSHTERVGVLCSFIVYDDGFIRFWSLVSVATSKINMRCSSLKTAALASWPVQCRPLVERRRRWLLDVLHCKEPMMSEHVVTGFVAYLRFGVAWCPPGLCFGPNSRGGA